MTKRFLFQGIVIEDEIFFFTVTPSWSVRCAIAR